MLMLRCRVRVNVLMGLLCVVLLGAFGCTSGDKEAPDKGALEGVALEYWENRLVTPRDYQKSYEREIDKAQMTFENYQKLVSRNEKFSFSDIKTAVNEIQGLKGMVLVSLKAQVTIIPEPIERTFKDSWRYSEDSGQWLHQFSKNQP